MTLLLVGDAIVAAIKGTEPHELTDGFGVLLIVAIAIAAIGDLRRAGA